VNGSIATDTNQRSSITIKTTRQSFFPMEFPNDQEAEAFAGRFDRKEPPGLTPLGV
jgi:hypothetical protein